MTLSSKFDKSSYEWKEIKILLNVERLKLIERLVNQDNPEVRGSIKKIDEILSLDKESESGGDSSADENAPMY